MTGLNVDPGLWGAGCCPPPPSACPRRWGLEWGRSPSMGTCYRSGAFHTITVTPHNLHNLGGFSFHFLYRLPMFPRGRNEASLKQEGTHTKPHKLECRSCICDSGHTTHFVKGQRLKTTPNCSCVKPQVWRWGGQWHVLPLYWDKSRLCPHCAQV